MSTHRKPVAGLVVALATVFVYAALPGTAQADPDPDIRGVWKSNFGNALFHQTDDNQVWGGFQGPLGIVQFEGSFTGPRSLRLTIDGVEHDGVARLWVLSGDKRMRGFIKLDDIRIRFRWRLWRP
jgi:hypothetical protein